MYYVTVRDGAIYSVSRRPVEFISAGVTYPKQAWARMGESELNQLGAFLVLQTAPPRHDPITETRRAEVVMVDGAPAESWVVTPLPAGDAESNRVRGLKALCRDKIYSHHSDTDQRNGVMEAVDLMDRRERGLPLSLVDTDRIAELQVISGWIQSMVATCRQAVADGTAVGAVTWPAHPTE